ncbi:MAG TPA: autotransporter domain-containing protein [Caulobacteraceae bacterium]|jgi:autotransporter-associated beta strand protein
MTGGSIAGQTGIEFNNPGGSVTNSGTIGGASGDGVQFGNGGSTNNSLGGHITGSSSGVESYGGQSYLNNAGRITGQGGYGAFIWAGTTANVVNQSTGVISGASGGLGVLEQGEITNAGLITGLSTYSSGVVANGASVANLAGGTISGVAYGAVILGGVRLTNAGAIEGAGVAGVAGTFGADVTNLATGSIQGGDGGVVLFGKYLSNLAGGNIQGSLALPGDSTRHAPNSFTNWGLVSGGQFGVGFTAGGELTNEASATIVGGKYGVEFFAGGYLAPDGSRIGATITNAGVISGATASIVFSGVGPNSLTLQTGSTLVGDAVGSTASGATNALILQGSGVANNDFVNFNTLAMQGPGTWTLAGASAIGSSEIAAGQLVVTGALASAFQVDAGATLQGGSANLLAQGAVTDNGSLVFDQPTDGAFAAPITGTGALVKQNAGVLTLSGGSNVASTTIAAGGLIVTGSLISAFSISPGAILQGGAANLAGAVTDNGELIFNQSTDGTFGNPIVGAGTLLKSGAGSLTLAGASSVTSTVVGAGQLLVTGSLASSFTVQNGATLQGGVANLLPQGAIDDEGALVLDQPTDATFGGEVAGGGALIKQGAGALTLSGTSATGSTDVHGGALVVTGSLASAFTIDSGATLQGGVGNLGAVGAIVDNGTLIFDQPTTAIFAGAVNGAGAMVKQGAGELVLNGVSAVSTTAINAGNLAIGDAGHASAVLTSAVAVNPGATLSGHGTIIGAVTNNGGTVAPGGSIGTLTITGTYTQTPTGTLSIAATPAGSSTLAISGLATLAGTLQVTEASGFYRKGAVFDVLSAGSISGAFSNVIVAGPGAFTVTTQGGTVAAVAQQGNLQPIGGGANVNAVGSAVNNYGAGVHPDFDPVLDQIAALPSGGVQNAALAELGDEVGADLITASRQSVRGRLAGLADQLDRRGEAQGGGDADPLWLVGFGSYGSVKASAGAHGFKTETGGLNGGVQRDFGNATLGASVSYDDTSVTLSGIGQHGDLADTAAGLYGEERFGTWFADASGVIGFNYGNLQRRIELPGVSLKPAASFNGGSGGISVGFGDRIASGGWLFEPSVSLSWTRVRQGSFTETGAGGADLAVAAGSQDFGQSLLGARVAHASTLAGGGVLSVDADLAWAHEFQDVTPVAAESFAGVAGTGFAQAGVTTGRDAAMVRAGLTYSLAKLALFAHYDGAFSDRANQHTISAGFRLAW